MNKSKKYLIFLISIFTAVFLMKPDTKTNYIEELEISVGIGYTINEQDKSLFYGVPIDSIMFKEDGKNVSVIRKGTSETIGLTRDDRQRKSDKKFFLGTERLYIIDEKIASFGIEPIIDILFKNPAVNDNGYVVVSKGNPEEYLKKNIEGYNAPAEYIEGMIKNASGYNFFSKNYDLRNAYLSIGSEGRNLASPFIELKEDGFQITGMAMFDEDKLSYIIPIDEARVLNLLRENDAKGMLTIQKNSNEYINFDSASKRKVKCKKQDGKYKFTIDLNIKGEVVNNKLYPNLAADTEQGKKFEKDMENQVEAMCNDFVKKMQNVYKKDFLNLGSVAVAKYGRGTGVNWNEVVSNSDIEIKVKVHLDKIGRGEY